MSNRKLWHLWGRLYHRWKFTIICRSPRVWKKLLLIAVPSNFITCTCREKKTPSPRLTSSCRHTCARYIKHRFYLSSPFSLSLNSSPLHPLSPKCIGCTCSQRITFDHLRPGGIIIVHDTLFTFLRGHIRLELDGSGTDVVKLHCWDCVDTLLWLELVENIL